MANNGALKSSHQDGFDLGLLAGGRHDYKNKSLGQGKQTVCKIKSNIKSGIDIILVQKMRVNRIESLVRKIWDQLWYKVQTNGLENRMHNI